MDKETQKDTRQRMQKKDNAPCNNQSIRTKRKEDKKEGNLPPRKLSPKKCLQKNKKQKNPPSATKKEKKKGSNKIPHIRLSPSILSRLVGSMGPMSPPAKKVLLWIESPGAMAAANMATRSAVVTCSLELAVNRS
jgi:hypothetical protein